MIHNESVNIWTHLLGTIIVIFLIVYTSLVIKSNKHQIIDILDNKWSMLNEEFKNFTEPLLHKFHNIPSFQNISDSIPSLQNITDSIPSFQNITSNINKIYSRLLNSYDWYTILSIIDNNKIKDLLKDEVLQLIWPKSVSKKYYNAKRILYK